MNKNNEPLTDSEDDDDFFLKPIKTINNSISTKQSKCPQNSPNDSARTTVSEIIIQEMNENKNENSKNNEQKIEQIKEVKEIKKIEPIKENKELKQKLNIEYSYLKIDKSNIFTVLTKNDNNYIEDIINSFKESKEKKNTLNSIFTPFLDKISPSCGGDPISISKSLSKEIFKFNRINKDIVENFINYFFNFRYELLYSTHFFLSIKAIRYLGYILSYTYNKFHKYSIKDGKHFNTLLQKTLEINEDVLIDYYNSLNDIGLEDVEKNDKYKKMVFWKKNRTKYLLPPEINFLVNRFVKITSCEIELDFQGTSITEKDFNVISLFFLNINRIFVNLKQLKINFTNQKLQYDLYCGYFQDLLYETQINKNIIKKNKIINHELIYEEKWNFKDKFNAKEYRNIRKIKLNEEIHKQNLIYDEYNLLFVNYSKKEINEKQMMNSTIEKIRVEETNNNTLNKTMTNDKILKDIVILKKNTISIHNITDGKNNYINNIHNNENILNLILMMICSLGRLKNIEGLELIINDSYNNELIFNLVNLYDINEDLFDINFHILDMINNKINKLNKLNFEFNSLEQLVFNKVLNLIYNNQDLIQLNLSFFSSDITYFRRTLLKLYNQTFGKVEKLIIYKDNKIEEEILNSLSIFFIENLSVLFSILIKMPKLEKLGFNFDLPSIFFYKQNYIIPIIKFILNILLYIDNYNCNINALTILASSIILDQRILNGMNKTFSEIEINKGENNLKELNIQIQLYHIINIKNLISTKLIILNIGDLDIISFKSLVKYLTSYKFASESNLETLSIRLNNSLASFTTDLKLTLRELFYIKASKLSELNLYTNIIINNELDYHYLVNILKDNWIPNYTITFHSKSNKILNKCQTLLKDIFYYPSNDENEFFWILKYLFKVKYANSLTNFFNIKSYINDILKYLCNKKEIKVNHSLENKLKNEKNG